MTRPQIIALVIRRVNRRCPVGWRPGPDDWATLDPLEAAMYAAPTPAALAECCQRYEDAAGELFAAYTVMNCW